MRRKTSRKWVNASPRKMGVETRELKKMSFSGEIKSNAKVTSISAEQRESAREAKEEKTPTPKSGKKKVSFAEELLEHAPRSKMYVTQLTNVRCVRCRASQPGTAEPVGLARATGKLAPGQGLLRRSLSGRAPSDYGRVPATDRR